MPPDDAGPFRSARAMQLFPTVVLQLSLVEGAQLNERLLAEITAIRAAHPRWKGRERPWQCAPDLHEREPFAPLVAAVHDAVRIGNQALRYVVGGQRITGMWANWLGAGEQHPKHAHANNFWSGVYYVRADGPRSARLVLHHPNPAARVILPQRSEVTLSNALSWALDVEAGGLVLFPSWLEHHVEVVPSGERVSVAFNVQITGDLLEPDSLQWGHIG